MKSHSPTDSEKPTERTKKRNGKRPQKKTILINGTEYEWNRIVINFGAGPFDGVVKKAI